MSEQLRAFTCEGRRGYQVAKKWKEIAHKSTPERVAQVRERAQLASAILRLTADDWEIDRKRHNPRILRGL